MHTTKVFSDLLAAFVDPSVRIIALKGSARSSKTWSTLQLIDQIGRRMPYDEVFSVVSETLPHLKRGAMRDFEKLLKDESMFEQKRWHGTNNTYQYDNMLLEFFSAGNFDKVVGPSRKHLYINEAINIEYEVYRQLAIRTTGKIILDYNPAWEFWLDTKLAGREDLRILHSTYLDNDFLSAAQVADIESNRYTDPDWFAVYGLGQTGSVKGLVIKNWSIVPRMPKNLKKQWLGIDFGWTNPSAVIHIGLGTDGKVYLDEILYERNKDYADIAKAIKDAGLEGLEAICDSADPRGISELRGYGIRRAKATESKAVPAGIQIMNKYHKCYTARSLNTIAENRKYRYAKDKRTDEYINEVIEKDDHAKDAERYVFLSRLANNIPIFDVRTSA